VISFRSELKSEFAKRLKAQITRAKSSQLADDRLDGEAPAQFALWSWASSAASGLT
jgi:hypothetical protein